MWQSGRAIALSRPTCMNSQNTCVGRPPYRPWASTNCEEVTVVAIHGLVLHTREDSDGTRAAPVEFLTAVTGRLSERHQPSSAFSRVRSN
jgi:hypothetical protein